MSDRIRVAILSLYPRDVTRVAGGVRAVAYNLVSGLRQYRDLDVHVVHCHSDIDHDALVCEEGVTVHYLAMPRRRLIPNMLSGMWRICRLLRTLQPDVVSAHIPNYAVAALLSGYPSCYTIHGIAHEEARIYRESWFDRLRYGLYAACDAWAVRHTPDLIAISQYVMDEYRSRARGRWHRINNPLTDDFFAAQELAPEQPGRLLFAGSITEIKGIETLLEAVALLREQVPQLCLHLAGRVTSPSYEQKLRALVREKALEPHVVFRGLQDRTGMLREYAQSAVVVLPSWKENAPMAVIEAMAVGKPVVATRVGGVSELVAEGETGYLVPPGDATQMAQRLQQLLGDPALRVTMGRRARQEALRRFSISRVAKQYHDLYWQIAAERRG